MSGIKVLKLVLLVVLVSLSITGHADSNLILAEKNFFYQDGDGKLVILFHKPMGYLSHFPVSTGKSLNITLKELFSSIPAGTIVNDKLIVSREGNPPFTDINYEQSGSQNGTLTIQFNQQVEYSIQPSRDRTSLTITLKDIKQTTRSIASPTSSSLPAYAISLMTSSSPIDPDNQPALKNFHDYDIYVSEARSGNRIKYTLSLGYFYSPTVAKKNMQNLKPFYPAAWVNQVEGMQREIADTWFYNARLKRLKASPKKAPPNKIEQLMERTRQAMIDKNYKQAIRILTRIQQLGDHPYKKETKELLGLARERNNQFAHARAEYQEYLKLYPDGPDAERVKQRLLGLLTARSKPRQKLRASKPAGVEPEWDFFGSIFQFYRYQNTGTDTSETITTDSSLSSDVLYSGRKRGLDYNQKFYVALSNRLDFIEGRDDSDGRLHTLYYDISRRDGNYGGRIGRATHSSDGVLGRFDGINAYKQITPDSRLNLLAGYPVELSVRDALDTDRQFVAVSYDMNRLLWDTDVKLYAIDQTNEGLTDRRAIGSQFKYTDDSSSLFATLDYDIFFSELNQLTFIGTWRNKAQSSLSVVADYRKSPLLTTNNALIGQPNQSLSALREIYSDEEIYQIAKDRTATYSSITVSASTNLAADYQLTGDITISKLGNTKASAGVDATTGTDTEAFLSTSLIVNHLFSRSDITIFGARYSNATTADTIQLNFSSTFSLDGKWRISPRLILDSRDNSNGSSRTTLKPRLLVNYRASRAWKYELDMGYEEAQTDTTTTTDTENTFYISLGYIYDF